MPFLPRSSAKKIFSVTVIEPFPDHTTKQGLTLWTDQGGGKWRLFSVSCDPGRVRPNWRLFRNCGGQSMRETKQTTLR
jgi:hypothetical protein